MRSSADTNRPDRLMRATFRGRRASMARAVVGLALAIASAGGLSCSKRSNGTQLNVLIVVVDTLRADRLGCYGGEGGHSPLLDARAGEFFLFEQAQASSPWTAPALLSLVTGLYPFVHGVRSYPTPERLGAGIQTLAERLSEAGYRTAAFTEGGYASPHFGLGRGFETFPRDEQDTRFEGINPLGGPRLEANVERCLRWLDERDARPFLLLLHTYEAHMPYRAPESLVRELRPDHDLAAERRAVQAVIEAWNARGELDLAAVHLLRRHYFLRPVLPGLLEAQRTDELLARAAALGSPLHMDEIPRSAQELALVQDLYDAEVRYVDRQLEDLLLEFERRGLERDTIVLLVSDHGEGLGDRGRLGHGEELHEELLRMLCMLRIPGPEWQPRRIADVVSSVDLLPTLLDLVGVDYDPDELQGRSLVDTLRGLPAQRAAASQALSSMGGLDPRTSLRVDGWRLILNERAEETELYDLHVDPRELANVAAQHPQVVRALAAQLEELREESTRLRNQLRGSVPSQGHLDEQLLRELRSFGYVDSR